MEYLPSNKFGHADGLSRLIPKYREPLEDTVMTSLQSEELKTFVFVFSKRTSNDVGTNQAGGFSRQTYQHKDENFTKRSANDGFFFFFFLHATMC